VKIRVLQVGALITKGRPVGTPCEGLWPGWGKECFLCLDVDASTALAILEVGDFIDRFDFGMPSALHERLVA
jgi:hypothetical protein